jgi:type II secretory pathway pseudopilin PulG
MKNTKNAIIILASIMVIVGTTLTPTLLQQVNAAVQVRSQHIDQENLCYRTNTCRQSDIGQNTLGNDNQVTGFADQSDNLQQTPTPTVVPTPTPTATPTPTPTRTPTPTPTPIPRQCHEGTVFDVTIQAVLPEGASLPIGTVLCLQSSGTNTGIVAILPAGTTGLVNVIVSPPNGSGGCAAPSVAAAVTSGVLPSPLSGTTVCVELVL